MTTKAQDLLAQFNTTYLKLHQDFEGLFWSVRMGDQDKANQLNEAEKVRDAFRSDAGNLQKVTALLVEPGLSSEEKERLVIWKNFFQLYQTPDELVSLRDKIAGLESKIDKKLATRKEGYTDPRTGHFMPASKVKMRMLVQADSNETIRKACWTALEQMSVEVLDEWVEVVKLRNQYAHALGFEDFYAYRVQICERMTKKQIFDIFDELYAKTKDTFLQIRKLEKSQPGLRKPWNFGYMMAGQFTKEEDQYHNFDSALTSWGRSFAALGIDYKGGTLQLDLLDRAGKYNNGFCHYPRLVNFTNSRNPGSANFTCNVVYGQVGTGFQGMHTLFHEGGHAADRLCSEQTDVCLNTEYPPASVAWAETHSQFLDTMFESIEWRTRYARNAQGEPYPFELFERKARELRLLAPLTLHGIMMVAEFEKRVYEMKDPTAKKIRDVAKDVYRKYQDRDEDSIAVLSIPHIYSWDSSAYYHAYGLAVLALEQWRKYFYDKYGYIVDNPNVGKELTAVWKLASAKSFGEFVKLATGQDLSPKAFITDVTIPIEAYLQRARQRIQKLASVPEYARPIELNAHIQMVHGEKIIADNTVSFEDMAEGYTLWLRSQAKNT